MAASNRRSTSQARIVADLPPLKIAWQQANATIVNPGYTIRVNMPPGSTLQVGRTAYEMVEFHFHAPAEHAVAGKRAAMEVHFVHSHAGGADPVHGSNDWEAEPQSGGFGVIGVFLQPGGANAAFAEIARSMPQAPGGEAPITVAPAALLPGALGYWAYAGSLTTPACAEIVTWMVLRDADRGRRGRHRPVPRTLSAQRAAVAAQAPPIRADFGLIMPVRIFCDV